MKTIFHLFIYKKLGINTKAGLEHRNYPYDMKRIKFTILDIIPSLIPSVPIDNNRTINVETLDQYS